MKCPKCQFDNIEKSKFCKECGNKLELVCPKCGYRQIDSEECVKCGIIINKFKKRQSLDEKRYKVKSSFLLFIKLLIVGCFILGFLLYLWRNYAPGGIEIAVAASILCVAFGIVFIFFHINNKPYFVSLTEKGINIANKKTISWEDIDDVKWNNEVFYVQGIIPIRSKWIDIYTSDEVEQKIVKIRITHIIENIDGLYNQINKRVNSEIEGDLVK